MGLHIAVIEDDAAYRTTLEEVLRGTGGVDQISGYETAEPFLEDHGTAGFDLALLDITLPGISGLEALRRLRTTEHPVPVVILSSSTDQADVDRAYDEGARGYLVKPLTLDELEDLLEDLVNMWSRMARPSHDLATA